MQRLEAQWLGERLAQVPDDALFPVVDVGSSSAAYRSEQQPFVEERLFAPLRARSGRVWHVDLKREPGVDLVGDLLEPAFRARVAALGARSALALNVLQHVVDPRAFASALCELVPARGLLFLSGARSQPPTLDPLDNGFRPTPAEVAALFPRAELVEGAILDSGDWRRWHASERGNRSLARYLARLALPVWRPARWLDVARAAPWLVRPLQCWVVVLRLR